MIDTLDHLLAITGGIVTILSALSSIVNHVIRTRQAAGEPVSGLLLGAGTVLNVGAVNLDKALQLSKQLRGGAAGAQPAVQPKE